MTSPRGGAAGGHAHPPAVHVLPIGSDSGTGAGGDLALHETAGTLAVDTAPAPGDAAGFPMPVGAFARDASGASESEAFQPVAPYPRL